MRTRILSICLGLCLFFAGATTVDAWESSSKDGALAHLNGDWKSFRVRPWMRSGILLQPQLQLSHFAPSDLTRKNPRARVFQGVTGASRLVVAANNKPSKTRTIPNVDDRKKAVVSSCDEVCKEHVAQVLLRSAFDFYKHKHLALAISYLKRILSRYSRTNSAKQAERLRSRWVQELRSRVDQTGRIEFIIFTSVYGLGLGIATPLAFGSSDTIALGISILGFTGAAVTASILATVGRRMSEGQASLVWTGTLWGAWNFTAIGIIADLQGEDNTKLALLGSLLGYGASVAIGVFTRPSPGQHMMAGSLGVWLGGYTGFVLQMIAEAGSSINTQAWFATLLVSSDIGFVGGLFLHNALRFSRSRSLLINLGGVLGGAAGVGVLLIIQQFVTINNTTPFLLTIMLTSLAGIALTTFLTRGFKPESKAGREGIASGSLFHYRNGQWSLDLPLPTIQPVSPLGSSQQPGILVTLPIASGSW